jgi:hypothetical protein
VQLAHRVTQNQLHLRAAAHPTTPSRGEGPMDGTAHRQTHTCTHTGTQSHPSLGGSDSGSIVIARCTLMAWCLCGVSLGQPPCTTPCALRTTSCWEGPCNDTNTHIHTHRIHQGRELSRPDPYVETECAGYKGKNPSSSSNNNNNNNNSSSSSSSSSDGVTPFPCSCRGSPTCPPGGRLSRGTAHAHPGSAWSWWRTEAAPTACPGPTRG